jgi:hypothetical protein
VNFDDSISNVKRNPEVNQGIDNNQKATIKKLQNDMMDQKTSALKNHMSAMSNNIGTIKNKNMFKEDSLTCNYSIDNEIKIALKHIFDFYAKLSKFNKNFSMEKNLEKETITKH